MAARADKLLLAQALEEKARRQTQRTTVVGVVDPEKGLTHAITNQSGEWVETTADPDVFIGAKLEPALKSKKRFVVLIGGRGSMKSVGGVDIALIDAKDTGSKTYFLREFQSSIKNSVYSLVKEEVKRLEFNELFDIQATSILKQGEDIFQFAGIARNIQSIKSTHGFKRFEIEEAQFLSQESIDELTPTARNKPNKGLPKKFSDTTDEEDNTLDGVQMVFIANPQSEQDPFSQRFIVPFQDALDRDGFYEDDLHLIVVINYYDNPWFDESGLEPERQWAYENMERAFYDHIWLGKYNDSVQNGLIKAEWFDACVDAHIKLGFEPRGAKIAAHDPSDTGPDPKGYAMRHGVVVQDVQEMTTGDVNEGGHWACGLAIQQGVDAYNWDCDGLGVGLNEQTALDFKDKHIQINQFKGSEGPDNPESVYKPAVASPVQQQVKIKDAIKNKRAQYYLELRDRCYRTYLAVVKGEYQDPDTLISFDSTMPLLRKLKAELCRMPIKPNGSGLIELYTKEEMKKKFKFPSPNLGDSVMMLMRYISSVVAKPYVPKPIKPMGRR